MKSSGEETTGNRKKRKAKKATFEVFEEIKQTIQELNSSRELKKRAEILHRKIGSMSAKKFLQRFTV